jgi:uncharacterized protein YecT (DUF1311 family)
MKDILILMVLLVLTQTAFSQVKISDSRLSEIKMKIEKDVSDLKKELEAKDDIELNKQLSIDFRLETYRIDTLLHRRIEIDYSTAGMIQATIEARDSYDKLLNKYYKLLMSKLNSVDQESLRQTQRNWIAFRDSEIKLCGVLSKDEYSGGGTIQRTIVSGEVLDLTVKRVLDLYGYLIGIQE